MTEPIIMDVTPPPQLWKMPVQVVMQQESQVTLFAIGAGNHFRHGEIPYGEYRPLPPNAVISIRSGGKEIGQVPTDVLFEAQKTNEGILAQYAQQLLNGETKKNFLEFVTEEQSKMKESLQQFIKENWPKAPLEPRPFEPGPRRNGFRNPEKGKA